MLWGGSSSLLWKPADYLLWLLALYKSYFLAWNALREHTYLSFWRREQKRTWGLIAELGTSFQNVVGFMESQILAMEAICPPGTEFKVDFRTHKAAPLPPTLLVMTAGEMMLLVPRHVALTWLSQPSLPVQKESWVCSEDGHLLTLCKRAGAQPQGISQSPPLQSLWWKWNKAFEAISLVPVMSNKFTVKAAETKLF